MAGDYSRNTHDPAKHYTRVLIQQGRVQLDSDANEASANLLHRITAETRDVIGETGAPKYGGGFALAKTGDGSDLTLSPGNLYVHGILVENDGSAVGASVTTGDVDLVLPKLILDARRIEQDQWLEITVGANAQIAKVTNVDPETSTITIADAITSTGDARIRRATTFLTQPFATPDMPADGVYSAYLKVWEAEVSALEDEEIREIALGGPDTAQRQQTRWQVALRELDSSTDCANAATQLATAFKPPTGLLAARTAPVQGETDPCLLPPTAGYLGLENDLYRIEIHRAGELPNADPTKRPTFKWARSNASLAVTVENVNVKDLKVQELGKDDLFRFEQNDWVELIDDASRRGDPHPLRQIGTIDPGKRLVKLTANPPATSGEHVLLRRWNHDDAAADENGVNIEDDDWIDLQYGIQVRFADGVYHAGDYWEVPARTAIHDVLWPRYDEDTPEHLPPRGIARYYTALAVVTVAGGKFTSIVDCRKLFPPLTHICADDVCFDNTNCKLPGATTVQEAIDELCARDDFDFYKKHLFGFGVVCGLQLGCAGAGVKSILVKSGYAIDCEGRDIKLRKGIELDLTKLPEWDKLKDEKSVCLSIERGNGEPAFHLSKKQEKGFLDGTPLMEAYEECFKTITDYFAKNFEPDTKPEPPVSDGQKRLTTAWNILVQLYNPTAGRRVLISEEEHGILATIYKELTELLKISNTYCAFGAVPPFPDYPGFPTKTWFGKNDHKRVRITPNGNTAFLFSANQRIDVFDQAKGLMVDQLEFPNNGTVRDVALSNDGDRLYAIAESAGASFIAMYDTASKKWTAPAPLKKDKIGMMAVDVGGVELYGAGEHGIWQINPTNGDMVLRNDTRTSGHIAVEQKARRMVISARTDAVMPFGKYDSMVVFEIASSGQLRKMSTIPFGGETGSEGVAISANKSLSEIDVYAVVDDAAGGAKRILAVDQKDNPFMIDLGVNTEVALTGVANQAQPMAALTLGDTYQARFITVNEKRFRELDLRIVPSQICPSSIAVAANGRLYVANHASRTISWYEPKVIADPEPVDLEALKKYREAVVEAFKDLIILLAQSLKDCLCDHLLIDCPQCKKEDVVYLGCLELDKERNVQRICPIEQRQFVLSPRLIGYWLSLVPVLPVIRKVVEWFCCLDIPALFEDKIPIPPDGEPDSKPCTAFPKFHNITKAGLKAPFEKQWRSLRKRAPFLVDIFMEQDTATATVNPKEIANQPVETAKVKLGNLGINVTEVEQYDASKGFTHFRRALTDLTPGQSVVLVERDGKVLYAHERVSTKSIANISAVRPSVDPEAIRKNVEEEVSRVSADLRKSIDERDTTIRALTEQLGKVQEELKSARKFQVEAETRLGAIDELREAVTKLQRRPPIG